MENTWTLPDAFPSLEGIESTLHTLHANCRAVAAIPRAHAAPQLRWQHVALLVQPYGLCSREIALPDGDTLHLKVDLLTHQVEMVTSQGPREVASLLEGLSATQLAEGLIEAAAELGLEGEYETTKYADDASGRYDPQQAGVFLQALRKAEHILKKLRAEIDGETGPVQLWPHGFDLAFEWFGSRMVDYEEEGQVRQAPAQLGIGFSTGEPSHPQPYFYCNPWPFESQQLVDHRLPHGARWFQQSWQGSLLPYADLVGVTQAEQMLLAYFRAVMQLARPILFG